MVPLVSAVAAMPDMFRAGFLPTHASSDFAAILNDFSSRGWGEVLTGAFAAEGSPEAALRAARRPSRYRPARGGIEFDSLLSSRGQDASPDYDPSDPLHQRLIYCFSGAFMNRVGEWLSRLLAGNMEDLYSWAAPPVPVFTALSALGPIQDDHARWLWERYTKPLSAIGLKRRSCRNGECILNFMKYRYLDKHGQNEVRTWVKLLTWHY